MRYEVEYYEKSDGERPAEAFILAQDNKMQAKIFTVLTFLEEAGPALREPYSKSLGDGIFEVRAKQGSDISRVLYFFVIGKKVILTNGFVKNRKRHLWVRSNAPNDTAPITKAGRRTNDEQEFS